jgi:hypothetical protein
MPPQIRAGVVDEAIDNRKVVPAPGSRDSRDRGIRAFGAVTAKRHVSASAAQRMAIACPMPLVPPATRIFLPVSMTTGYTTQLEAT